MHDVVAHHCKVAAAPRYRAILDNHVLPFPGAMKFSGVGEARGLRIPPTPLTFSLRCSRWPSHLALCPARNPCPGVHRCQMRPCERGGAWIAPVARFRLSVFFTSFRPGRAARTRASRLRQAPPPSGPSAAPASAFNCRRSMSLPRPSHPRCPPRARAVSCRPRARPAPSLGN